MSELPPTADALAAEVLAEVPDARIEEDFEELHRAMELLELERLRRLAEIDRRRRYERDGHLSAAAWLVARFKVASGHARDSVRVAGSLGEMPRTRRALSERDLSLSAVRVLVSARDADPEAFEGAEATLVEAARIHSNSDLRRAAAFWREAVEQEKALSGEEKVLAMRRLQASKTFLGMVRVDGDLDWSTASRCFRR